MPFQSFNSCCAVLGCHYLCKANAILKSLQFTVQTIDNCACAEGPVVFNSCSDAPLGVVFAEAVVEQEVCERVVEVRPQAHQAVSLVRVGDLPA